MELREQDRLESAGKRKAVLEEVAQEAKRELGQHSRRHQIVKYKYRGRIGELLAVREAKERLDLNAAVTENFPVYDVSDSRGMYSVKVRSLKDGQVRVADYAHDLRVATGAVKASRGKYAGHSGVEVAAERLWQVRSQEPSTWQTIKSHFPPSVRRANSETSCAQALSETAHLLIPVDHVQPTRDYVRRVANKHPELYGISPDKEGKAKEKAIEQLVHRIQPIKKGVTFEQINREASHIHLYSKS